MKEEYAFPEKDVFQKPIQLKQIKSFVPFLSAGWGS